MDPIGATRSWEWHGYYNSDVTIAGRRTKSVSGGGRWGGGLWMSTRDLARFGQLLASRGQWGENRIVSEEWIDRATTPCEIEAGYGYLFWLNTDRERWPAASESVFAARGHGANTVWIDPDRDLVVVLRWIESDAATGDRENDGFYRRLIESLDYSSS
jgi:CubicO group peptidase (beta-lactamase class C family)